MHVKKPGFEKTQVFSRISEVTGVEAANVALERISPSLFV